MLFPRYSLVASKTILKHFLVADIYEWISFCFLNSTLVHPYRSFYLSKHVKLVQASSDSYHKNFCCRFFNIVMLVGSLWSRLLLVKIWWFISNLFLPLFRCHFFLNVFSIDVVFEHFDWDGRFFKSLITKNFVFNRRHYILEGCQIFSLEVTGQLFLLKSLTLHIYVQPDKGSFFFFDFGSAWVFHCAVILWICK